MSIGDFLEKGSGALFENGSLRNARRAQNGALFFWDRIMGERIIFLRYGAVRYEGKVLPRITRIVRICSTVLCAMKLTWIYRIYRIKAWRR